MQKVNMIIRYNIVLLSPLHIGTGTGSPGFLDKYYYRDVKKRGNGSAEQGRKQETISVVPGSAIKGVLRDSARKLLRGGIYSKAGYAAEKDRKEIFGMLFGSEGTVKGWFSFDDARLEDEQDVTDELINGVRSGVALDRYRRVALDKHLYTLETAGVSGTTFVGEIEGVIAADKKDMAVAMLKDAMRMVEYIGHGKSRGLGRCVFMMKSEGVN